MAAISSIVNKIVNKEKPASRSLQALAEMGIRIANIGLRGL
jgi:hypothetical protein